MAITLQATPTRFAPAYKPVQWTFSSDKFPNTIPGESGIVINTIRVAASIDVLAFGGTLAIGDVYIEHSPVTIGVWPIGQAIYITGTDNGLYDGQQRIIKEVSDVCTVIDTVDLGISFGGEASKYYEAFGLKVFVYLENLAEPAEKTITPNNVDGTMTVDIRDIAQRTFLDVFDLVRPEGSPARIANGYITQTYRIEAFEAHMIPDAEGTNEYTIPKVNPYISPDVFVVNSVQPYHHVDPITGDNDLLWEDNLDAYIMKTSISGGKFLTYAPRGYRNGYKKEEAVQVSLTDDYWLGFLLTNAGFPISFFVESFDINNVSLGQTITALGALPSGSAMMPVGPANLGASLVTGLHHYHVAILGPNGLMSEVFAFTIDSECYRDPVRMHWLNPFGAIDSFTYTEGGVRRTTTKRTTMSKPHMVTDLYTNTRRGDWQRRTFAVDIDRVYTASTKTIRLPMLTYLAEDLYESADVRLFRYDEETGPVWTWVIPTSNEVNIPVKSGRLSLEYQLGIDETKQRR